MSKVITLSYKARNWAKEFHNTDKRWIVLVLHRRAGKTVASLNHLIRECFRNGDSDKRYAYVAPTYKQGKNVAWDLLKQYARQVPNTKFNEAELRCDFPNGSRITIFGADNPDSLRGMAFWGVVFDEYSQQPSNIFTEIIRPALSDHKGFAIWIGTPKGKNDFYRLFSKAEMDDKWFALRLKASESGIIDDHELQSNRDNMTEDEFNQEFECSFESSLKGAYYGDEIAKLVAENRYKPVPHESILPVTTAWDWGMNDTTSIGFFQQVGNERRMIDYYENNDHGIEHYISMLYDKGYVYEKHIMPHDMRVREMSAEGRTRVEVAESLGLNNIELLDRFGFADGIQAVRTIFPSLWINSEKCELFMNAITQYQKEWDDARGEYKDKEKKDWTNHCFAGETRVLTNNGVYPIMELDDNYKILTTKGWKKFKNLGVTKKNATVLELTFNDKTKVKCTPNHKFLTTEGWIEAKNLKGKTIQSSLTIGRSFSMIGSTIYMLMKNIFLGETSDYTEKFGNFSTEKSKRDSISTTRMGVLQIMSLAILKDSEHQNILAKNGKRIIPMGEEYLHKLERLRLNGINRQKVFYGIEKMLKQEIKQLSKEKSRFVLSVEKFLKDFVGAVKMLKNSVIQTVKPLTIEELQKINKKEDVYDINTPIEHCFSLENGAVVHNSADMIRYYALGSHHDSGKEDTFDTFETEW